VIQLLYATGETKQDITLGVDAGSKKIGMSATTQKKELYSAEVDLRDDVSSLIATKKQYRRSRRYRKTRYRKARFDNRKRDEGYLAPSVQSKVDAHIRIIDMVKEILPISKIIVEVASFDIQKIKDPDICGVEYQQGDQLGFWNTREYVLYRDGHRCQGEKNCSNNVLNVHHIETRKTGGDSPDNLITLCEACHNKYHQGKLKLNLIRGQSYRDAAFMGIMRWSLYNMLKQLYTAVELTYGYITKNTRIINALPKEHRIDAFCITGNIKAGRSEKYYKIRQVRKKKRSLHEAVARKGRKEPNTTAKRNKKNTKHIQHKGLCWCLWDKVRVAGQIGYITGFTGNMVYVQDIEGNYIRTSTKYKQMATDNIKLIERNNNWVSHHVS
jgi:N6-L-threonylcarbamoyladenine synthase